MIWIFSILIPTACNPHMVVLRAEYQIAGSGLVPRNRIAAAVLGLYALAVPYGILPMRGIAKHQVQKAAAVRSIGTAGAGEGLPSAQTFCSVPHCGSHPNTRL